MRLVLVTNYVPDRRPLSEYGYHLAHGLIGSRGGDLAVVSGRAPVRSPDGELRVWTHGTPRIPLEVLRALRMLRPDAVLVNTHFTSWGSNLANFAGLLLPMLAKRACPRTITLLHHLPQTMNVRRAGYRLTPAHWLAIDLACRALARSDLICWNHPVQPTPLERWEEAEILRFLTADGHDRWAYVTIGLGEAEFARLSRLTTARSIDGTYYTARWQPEARESGAGMVDGYLWWGTPGQRALFRVLQRPADLSLKWAVVVRREAEEHLRNSGWEQVWSLVHPVGSDASYKPGDPVYSRVSIWQVPDAVGVPPIDPEPRVGPPYYRESPDPVRRFVRGLLPYLWGTLPLLCLGLGLATASLGLRAGRAGEVSPEEEVTYQTYSGATGLRTASTVNARRA